MPASLSKAYKQINIGLLTAQCIPDMDLALLSKITTNCYITAKWGKKELRTETFDKAKDQDCVFNELFKFGVLWPMTADRMPLKFFDEDLMGSDAIGAVDMKLK